MYIQADIFYPEYDREENERWSKMGRVLSVEMETAALYIVAARAGKKHYPY